MSDYFPFELSQFQNQAIDAIKRGEHCLVTAHTGSGKTVPAEFAIQYFTSQGKRIIYTSPIKALSNQKLHDFREKYPHITFGIVTGDIEDNKEAQVLIMTTEILSNSLLNREIKKDSTVSIDTPLRFNMDYENDLAAVVFDEVHYISDSTRGQAWEQSMMLLPKTVVYIMLSATIANPFVLVNWIQDVTKKPVCLASTSERVVPLKHYVYTPNVSEKKIRNMTPEAQSRVNKYCNELTLIKEGEGQTFDQALYTTIYNTYMHHMKEYDPNMTIPDLVRKLKTNDMLPALFFVFSRNATELLAEKLCSSGIPSLFSKEETTGHDMSIRIGKECRHLLSKKIPNYDDFLECAELQHLLSCISKGVAYHHAGMMPVLRELVEFLDAKGYVKILFATETFAVGVNMPTRTVVFTSINKYSEDGERLLKPHEYTQMAGRAGRRGLDTVGHCIILSPELCAPNSLATVLTGRPTTITSNYRISYHLVLGCLSANNICMHYDELVNRSMEYSKNSLSTPNQSFFIDNLKKELLKTHEEYEKTAEQLGVIKTPVEVIEKYKEISKKLASGMISSKMTKSLSRDSCKLCQDNFYLERDYEIMKKCWKKESELKNKEQEIKDAEDYMLSEIKAAIKVLVTTGFIVKSTNGEELCEITEIGKYALSIYEAHPLGLPLALKKHCNLYKDFRGDIKAEAARLAQLLSVFCDVKVNDWNTQYDAKDILSIVEDAYNYVYDVEQDACGNGQFYISQNYNVQCLIYKHIGLWCNAVTNQDCREVIWTVNSDTGISTGDFIKSIMKIIKLSKELMSGAELTGNLIFASICTEVPKCLLKYLATTQSLYV